MKVIEQPEEDEQPEDEPDQTTDKLNDQRQTTPPATESESTNKIVIDVPGQNIYETIAQDAEHIYDDIYVDFDSARDAKPEAKQSIFVGASKDEILEYLEDAKGRVEILIGNDTLTTTTTDKLTPVPEEIDSPSSTLQQISGLALSSSSSRRNRTSNVSNSSSDSAMTYASLFDVDEERGKLAVSSSLIQLVERNDSGVGAETNKPAKLRRSASATVGEAERQCTDCEQPVEPTEDDATG